MKKRIIIGSSLLLLCGLFIYLYNNKLAFFQKNSVNLYEVTNSGSKKENLNAYLEATYIASTLANFDNNSKESFFVVFGSDVQFIVYMNNNEAKKINKYLLDNPNKSYKLLGVTKLIPDSMEEYGKKFVKEWLDINHHHEEEVHSHDISTDDFYHYFGNVYLDTTVNNNSLLIYKIVIYVLGISSLLVFISPIIKKNI